MQRVVLERFVAEDGRIRIDLEVAPAVGYATVSSRLAAVRRLSVTNIGDQPVAGLRLTIELLSTGGLISPPWTVTPQKALLPESILTWEDFGALAPSLAVLREIDETFTADYRAVASHAEGPSLRMVAPTTVLAHNEWFNSPALQDSLAAFVQPSSYAVDTVLRAAAGILLNRTGSAALQGYQAGPDRAIMIAGAVYEGLRGLGLRVRKPPGDGPFEQAAHRIRMTSAVLNQRAGTALDLSVTYAACLGAAGLRPLIWLSRQHAFAGLLPDERTLGATVVTDHETILSLVDSGLVIPVELTGIGGGEAASVDFTDAVAAGLENFRTVEVLSVVDVALAHRSDIQPIASGERPVSEDMPTSIISPVITTAAGEAGRIVLPEGVAKTRLSRHSSEGDEAPPLADPAPARIRRWKKALLDLSLRNPLLNLPSDRYKGVDLHLAAGSLAVLDDLIHDGDPLHLVADHNLTPEDLTSRLTAHRRVELSLSPQRYVATMRTLQRDARTMQQETGGNYLYLTLGTLVHPKTGGGQASAPLFLLPVRIEGGAGGSGYSLVIDGPEIAAPNHCLVEWLRVKHDVRVPQLEYPAQDEHGIDIPKALAAISAGLVEHQLPYHVEERASLRLLQFPTFQLWRDLTDHWATFLENPVVRHLVTAGGEPFADPAGNDHCPQVDEASLHLPIPADGSQMRAVMMAERGQSFVLEGPPGTGKSQTITNLIARCIASGRTVLFVAEKEAALDVVRSRLARIGLAPFVLNLHGRKQSMNAIRQQLLEALAQYDRSDPAAWKATVAAYQTMIAPLIAYPDRVHRPNASGLSTWSAYEALLATDDSPNDGTVDGPVAPIPPEYLELPDERRARVELALRELPMVARSAGLRPGHPWACCGRHTVTGLDASVVTGIAANLEAIRSQLAQRPSLVTLLRGLASPFELAELLPAVRLAVTGTLAGRAPTSVVATTQPDATGEHAALRREVDPAWEGNASAVEADLAMFHQTYIAELHAFRPEIYDHAALDAWYEEARDAGARLFGRAKRLATISDRLAAYLRTPTPLDPDALERLLARLLAIRSHESAINQRVRELGCLGLPPGWRPVDATALARFAEAKNASVITGQLQTRHPAVLALLERGISADDADLLERLAGGWGSWSTSLQIGEAEVLRWVAGLHWLDAWQRDGQQWLTDLREGQLRAIWRWGALLSHADVLAEAGLTQLRELLLSGELPMPAAELAYRRGVATTALAERLRSEGLEYFDAEAHDARISQFAAVREELQTALTTRIPAGLLRRRPFDPADCHGRVAAVLAELNRRRGGKSFRDLYAAAADVILALTPCVLVSPASAATFLPPDATKFDLVVFDEASQIRTAEAIGPMGRGRATIVVGDSQQMPPSRMMRAAGGIADVDLGDEIAQLDELPEDRDSILREAVESQLPQCWLSWHYRSCDESLIAFSNHHFYADRLSSLPSPNPMVGSAISWHRVDGVFDRGGSRTNVIEARAVVAEIARRLADRSETRRSIGVVTFNVQQRDLILNLLEESTDQGIRASMAPAIIEPIFVKNLENVQGDERDVILFSLAFSKNPSTGQLPLNFGPLGQLGGERRLNVAITRARREVALFASFDPSDLDCTRTTAVGPHRLRQYCELAADAPRRLAELVASRDARSAGTGLAAGGPAAGGPAPGGPAAGRDPVRDEIAAVIRARGYEVTTGHGLSTFTADLAVRRPGVPQWQVAILLDGPSWSRRSTVADRDIAPTLLTSIMGWPSVLRCWLPAWISDREAFLGRLEAALPSC